MSRTPPTLQYASASHSRPYSRLAVFVSCASTALFVVPLFMMSIASSTEPDVLYDFLLANEDRMYGTMFALPFACLLLSMFAHARINRLRNVKRGHALTVIAVLLALLNMGFGLCAGEVIRGIGC